MRALHMSPAPAAILTMAAFLWAGCDRVPSEPRSVPQPSRSAAHEAGEENAPARCWVPTPATAALPTPHPGADPRCPVDPDQGPPMVPVAHISFKDAGAAPKLEVELMLTEQRQERGLMYRKSLADNRGMLFAWDNPSVHTFWMHNTCIPLDMLFIDADGFIAGIVENAPTLDDGARSIDCPVSYVLEVNAGWCRKYGVRAGQWVGIDAFK